MCGSDKSLRVPWNHLPSIDFTNYFLPPWFRQHRFTCRGPSDSNLVGIGLLMASPSFHLVLVVVVVRNLLASVFLAAFSSPSNRSEERRVGKVFRCWCW